MVSGKRAAHNARHTWRLAVGAAGSGGGIEARQGFSSGGRGHCG
ncbi:MAG TPA: hypothetical protein VHL10_01735 [Nitrososphaera sp.]|nr:hypothetical protein [Nitrososphaera sp.]